MKYLLIALALMLAPMGYAAEATVSLNYAATQSGSSWLNLAAQDTLTSSESNVVITVTPGYPVYVQFAPPASGSNTWTYSTSSGVSTQTTTVAAGQNLVLWFHATTTLYLTSTTGTTLSISCLRYDTTTGP